MGKDKSMVKFSFLGAPIQTLSVQKNKKSHQPEPRKNLQAPEVTFSDWEGWEKNSNPPEKKEKTLRNEKPDSRSTKTPKSEKKVALT